MAARVNQAAVLILAEEFAEPRINQAAVLVLWGLPADPRLHQAAVLLLGRHPKRRIFGVID